MSTDAVVFRYRVTNQHERIYTDTLGRDNEVQVGLFLQYQLPPGSFLTYFGDMPNLNFRGGGTVAYEETWTAEVDPQLGGNSNTSVLGVMAFGTSIGATSDYQTNGQSSNFFRAPTAMRVTVSLSSPAGSYSKTVRFTGGAVRSMPSPSVPPWQVGFGAYLFASANGLNIPGYTNYPNVQRQTISVEIFGQSPPWADLEGEINGVTPGRYAKYACHNGSSTAEAGSGDPLANPGDVVTAGSAHRCIPPWKYKLRFDMVDLEGSARSAPVLFLKTTDELLRPIDVETRGGSFEETVSQDYQWQISQGQTERYTGGLGGTRVEHYVDNGHTLAETLRFPCFGVMLPRSALTGGTSPYTPKERWLGDDWPTVYDDFAVATDVPLTATMRPPQQGKRYPVPLSGPFDPDAEFTLRNVKLKKRSNLPRQPSTWTIIGSPPGASVSGSTLTAGDQVARFQALPPVPPGVFGFLHPYRFMVIDTVASKAGEIEIHLYQPSPNGTCVKGYKVKVPQGSSKLWIDTCSPAKMYIGPGFQVNFQEGNNLPRIDGQNVELGLPQRVSQGRFGGIVSINRIEIRFSDNQITFSNFGGEVRAVAQARQSSPLFTYDPGKLDGSLGANYDEPQPPPYLFYGHVDGKDAFRVSNVLSGSETFPFELTGPYPVPPGLLTPPHVDRQGNLWPMVDMVSQGVDVKYSYFYGRFGASFVGADRIGVWGDTPTFHCSLPWGNALGVLTPKQGTANLRRETFDSTLVSQDIDLATSAQGRGFTVLDTFFPIGVSPFAWGATSPGESFGGGAARTYHFRYYDRNQNIPRDLVKQVESLSWGAVYWIGVLPAPVQGGEGCVALRSAEVGYLVGYTDDDGALRCDSRWRPNIARVYDTLIDEGPGITEARLEVDPESLQFRVVYVKEGNLYRRWTMDFGETWIDPDGGSPHKEGVMHVRERFNPRTHEFLMFTMGEDLRIQVEIRDYRGEVQGTFPSGGGGIGGTDFDDASFDAEVFADADDGIDVIAMKDGARVRYRSSDEGRSYYAVPL